MIGYSSRNSRDRERRQQWWDTLTEEEKALETRRQAVEDRWFWYTFGGTFAFLVVLWTVIPHELFDHSTIARFVFMVSFPLCLVIGALVATHKKNQIR